MTSISGCAAWTAFYRWSHVRGFLLKDMDEKIVLCYLLLREIDEWKRAEELSGR